MSGKTSRKNIRLKISRGAKCSVCGYNKNLDALTWHHRDPKEKKKEAAGSTGETSKCDLVCLNCHAEIHSVLEKHIVPLKKPWWRIKWKKK